MIEEIKKNEIYMADLGDTLGSEENGIRPVLIVQNDIGNKYSPTTIVLPFTSKIERGKNMPTHIKVRAFGNLKYDSIILSEQIRIIDKKRLIRYIDELPNKYIKDVNTALKIAVGIGEEKN